MSRNGLPQVNTDMCTACGDCVDICPKKLFEIHPVSHRLWVACKNQEFGDAAEKWCEVACTACERCAMDAPEGLIQIRNNLSTIDYSKNALASPIAIQRCPTGAIVWLDDAGVQKGKNAKKVIRKEALPVM
jgi:Fe-S-cluster-containing hydrogenase component 2